MRLTLAHAYAELGAFDAIERLAPSMVPVMPAIACTMESSGLVFIELTDGSALAIDGPDIHVHGNAMDYQRAKRAEDRRKSMVRT